MIDIFTLNCKIGLEDSQTDFAMGGQTDFTPLSFPGRKKVLSLGRENTPQGKFDLPIFNKDRPPKTISKHEQAARLMWNTLVRLGRKEPSSKRLDLWIKEFKDYTSLDDSFNIDRVLVVVKWWCDNLHKHLRDPYFPKPKCAKTFCERFISIEDRMNASPSKQNTDFHSIDNLPIPDDDNKMTDEERHLEEEIKTKTLFDKL